jgi:hypothetical protein
MILSFDFVLLQSCPAPARIVILLTEIVRAAEQTASYTVKGNVMQVTLLC